MKFVLNTSLDPHFCALFDAQGVLLDLLFWENRKKTGEILWEFFKKNNIHEKKINFIGGISGPGGFSNLRGAAGVLNALSLKFNIPVYQVRADGFIQTLLKKNNLEGERFLLNSFSDGVFFQDKGGDLVRIPVEEAVEKFGENQIFVEFLPKEKQEKFLKKITLEPNDLPEILLESLKKTSPQKQFLPNYEFPAV